MSVFGFLASDMPHLSGNYGFKDQWLGLLWVRDNIVAFGGKIQRFIRSIDLLSGLAKTGNTSDIQLSGLSAGECFNRTIMIFLTSGMDFPKVPTPYTNFCIMYHYFLVEKWLHFRLRFFNQMQYCQFFSSPVEI